MRIDALTYDRASRRLSMTVSDALYARATLDEEGLLHGDRAYAFSLLDEVARAAGLDEGALGVVGEGSLEAPRYRLSGSAGGTPAERASAALDEGSRRVVGRALDDLLSLTVALLVMP